MKIRTCFVSNSSSSSSVTSECWMGIEFFNSASVGIKDLSWSRLSEVGLRRYVYGCGAEIVGLPVEAMGEQETVSHFRHKVFDGLAELGFSGGIAEVGWILPTFIIEVQ